MFSRKPVLLLLLTGGALLAGCQKEDPTELDGVVPATSFTVQLNTTQFPVVATFTNATTDGFLYQWDFGDGSPLAAGRNVTHTYLTPGTYTARLVAAGRGGSAVATQQVVVPGICGNAGYAVLTACAGSGSTSWTLSPDAGAVVRLAANGTTVLSTSAAPLPACQGDDQFSFASTFSYSYEAGAGTFRGGACGPALSGNSDFIYQPNANLGRIVLLRRGAFIGLPDSVVNKTYDIIEATPARLRLQGTNPDGTRTVTTYAPQLSALDRAKQLLTGGAARTWVLDNDNAAPITVGTEAAPTSYFPGAPAGGLPGCQADDEYTFKADNTLTYNALAETFVAGDFTCQAPRSGTTPFVFGPASGTGIAQFVLTNPGAFIGVTDAPATRIYRILSISNTSLVLRAGGPTADPVFTIRLKVK